MDIEAMKKELRAEMKEQITDAVNTVKAEGAANLSEFKSQVADALGIDKDGDVLAAASLIVKTSKEQSDAISKQATADFDSNINEVFASAKKAGKLLPAEEHGFRKIASVLRVEAAASGKASYSLSEKEDISGTPVEIMKTIFEKRAKVARLGGELGGGGVSHETPAAFEAPDDLVLQFGTADVPNSVGYGIGEDAAIRKLMDKHKLSYTQAFERLFSVSMAHIPENAAFSLQDDSGDTEIYA